MLWGVINALYLIPLLVFKRNRFYLDTVAEGKIFPSFKEMYHMFATYMLVVFSWVLFRAEDIGHAFQYYLGILSPSILTVPYFSGMRHAFFTLITISIFIIIEWFGRSEEYAIANIQTMQKGHQRWFLYMALIVVIVTLGNISDSVEFIYFQF